MKINKKYLSIASIFLVILIIPYILLSLFFSPYLDVNTLFLIFLGLIYNICFFSAIIYLFIKDKKGCRNYWSAFRYNLYYRGKVNMAIVPYMAFSVFFFLIFQSLGSVFSPLKSILISVILGIIVTVATVTTFFILIKKREIRILEEFKEIDSQGQRILKDLEKFEKQG